MKNRGKLTQLKVEEAAFFLGYLNPNYGKEKKFDFFLSAFISAARSVLWVMRSEYVDVEGWEAWYESVEPSPEEEILFRGTTSVRNRTQKVGSLQTMSMLAVDNIVVSESDSARIAETIENAHGEELKVHIGGSNGKYYVQLNCGGELLKLPVETVKFKRELKEFPDREILEVCKTYYESVASLVALCRSKFDAYS